MILVNWNFEYEIQNLEQKNENYTIAFASHFFCPHLNYSYFYFAGKHFYWGGVKSFTALNF